MSSKNESAVSLANPSKPVSLDAHEADKQARAAARDKKRKKLMDCTDSAVAAQYEARKPLYEWRVECSYMKPQEKGGLKRTTETGQVAAQTEADAWALFCDSLGLMVARRACEVKITRLERRSLED